MPNKEDFIMNRYYFRRLATNWALILVVLLITNVLLITTGVASENALMWSIALAVPIGIVLEFWRQASHLPPRDSKGQP